MIAAIFEVEPEDGRAGNYLSIAADIRPLLEGIEGFISVERFESLSQPDRSVDKQAPRARVNDARRKLVIARTNRPAGYRLS